jgi:hypothetical protein
MIAGRRLLGHTVTHDGDASAYVREMRRVMEIWASDLMRPTPLQRLFAKNGHFSRCISAAAHGGDEQNNNLWLPGTEPQSGGKDLLGVCPMSCSANSAMAVSTRHGRRVDHKPHACL